MKQLFFALVALVAVNSMAADAKSSAVSLSNSQKICDSLQNEIDDKCAHFMCDHDIAKGIYKDLAECTGSEDYVEAAQGGCEDDPTLEDLVKDYNDRNPNNKIQCE